MLANHNLLDSKIWFFNVIFSRFHSAFGNTNHLIMGEFRLQIEYIFKLKTNWLKVTANTFCPYLFT